MRSSFTPLSLLVLVLLSGACASEPGPEPEPLQAGTATVRMPVPLGIGTVGYNGLFGTPDNPSPYAERYPATERIHGHPDFTAVALSRGEGFELIILRSDMVAVVQQLRDSVVLELESRTGRNYDDALVISATHTHSGPGRFIQGGLYDLVADTFVPEFYSGLVSAMADAVEAALADLSPAELGVSFVDAADAHKDRRCEDGTDYTNDRLGIIAVRKEGQLDAVLLNYAIHGTILGLGDFTLSQDVSGAIEEKVAEALGPEVTVVHLNSWAGDVAPTSPGLVVESELSPQPSGYDAMEEIGIYLAGVVAGEIDGIETSNSPELESRSFRYPIDHYSIGYQWGEFDFLWGGVYCDAAGATCEEVLDHPNMVEACIPFPENSPAPFQSIVTVGRVDGAYFTTWAGESTTGLAERVMDGMRVQDGVEEVLFFGYANDYLGYQLEEEDWWHGGYEASGSMWGPRQGEYMAAIQEEVFGHWLAGEDSVLSFDDPGLAPAFELSGGVAWEHEAALDAGTVLVQPAATYAANGVAVFTVAGSSPGYGAPVARLQGDSGQGFEDLLSPGGRPRSSEDYGFWVDLAAEPPYSGEAGPIERRFRWSFSVPLHTRSQNLSQSEVVSYRFRVELPLADGSLTELLSEPFSID
ncbi:MAG: neutral/alkaline non-lysosomal ceramidase N-terminal domain-containing protein [Myxococcota bacterium]|nr:neutral/alkaline non-lysosomal ceramidase N-terminal domain-containing protein [Myxococcota bacterium]